MKKLALSLATLTASAVCAQAATFYGISGVSQTAGSGHYSNFVIGNLIQGSPAGYSATAPHDATAPAGGANLWVTTQPNGGGDYFTLPNGVPPVLVFDLGNDVSLTEISTWGYADGNTNGARDFSLRFATSAEGTGGFGTSITDQTGFIAAFDPIARDSNALTTNVTARYVEMTITDNWRGLQPHAGGDRVGLGEVAFAVPEPTVIAPLGLLGFGLLLRRRRR